MGKLVRKIGRSKERLGDAVYLQNGRTRHSAVIAFLILDMKQNQISNLNHMFHMLGFPFENCINTLPVIENLACIALFWNTCGNMLYKVDFPNLGMSRA